MRPTGRLHIGHYFGALQNWIRLQDDPEFQCFYFIADWHALTSDYADTSAVAQNTIEIMTDYLAAGLDPAKSVIFQQSFVPEHAELHLLLSMVTPLGWLERVPTYKEALENVKDKDLHNYGFLGYPVLQCADITIYSSPEISGLYVPVGEDQVSHVEASREIVRRFDNFYSWEVFRQRILDAPVGSPDWQAAVTLFERVANYNRPEAKFGQEPATKEVVDYLEASLPRAGVNEGAANLLNAHPGWKNIVDFSPVLLEPEAMLTSTPRIPGTDGRKMSKSYGNAIMLSDTNESIWGKVRPMKTDPARIRRTDKGDPDKCPVYDWHKLFSTKEALDWAAHGCRTAEIGCIDCKRRMLEHLVTWITPVRERRVDYETHPTRVREILDDGSKRARAEAQKTMERVREAVFGWDKKRKEIASGTNTASE